MIDKFRIDEAQKNINSYLADELIKKEKFEKVVYDTYYNNSKESIKVSDILLQNNISNLWVVVTSYYSMFYIANALLYNLGYKIGNKIAHKITLEALIVYVRNKLHKSLLENFEETKDNAMNLIKNQSDEIIESFDYERLKRSKFQYESTEEIKSSKANTSFNRAKIFFNEINKIIDSIQK
ncbi:hypothetical protein HOD20_09300 [archaeon]|jgi:uncharacterized protein (UPF0332 family)|nr:hypothetical protein [archaeon]MBT4352706.1 hypothetical protein [archaeon]MBT4648170.1 hypothetical protein [archaeon]MBT6822412.1 hypothetical protein [archaeon]MBT7391881.1 hypothetical protein [archaeon]